MTEDALPARVLLLCQGQVGIAGTVLDWVLKAEGPDRDRRMVALESCAARSLRVDGSAACLIRDAEKAETFLAKTKPARGANPGPGTKRALHGQNLIRETQR